MQAFLQIFIASKGFPRVMTLREKKKITIRTEILFPIPRPNINPTAGMLLLWYKAHLLSGPYGSGTAWVVKLGMEGGGTEFA